MGNGQRNVIRPAGATGPANPTFASDRQGQGGNWPLEFTLPVVPFTSWLSHNGMTCNSWSSMSRDQKIQYLRNFIFGLTFGINVPRDDYNSHVRCTMQQIIYGGTNCIGALGTPSRETNVRQLDSKTESGIQRIVAAIDNDCLRAAVVATNAPVSSVPVRPIYR